MSNHHLRIIPRNLWHNSTWNTDATFPSYARVSYKGGISVIHISQWSKFGYRGVFCRDKILHSLCIRMNITQWLLRFLSPLSGVKLNNNFTRTGWCNPKCRLPGAMARTAHLAVLSLAYHGTSSLGMRQQVPSGARFLTLHNLTAGRQRTLNLLLVNKHELYKTILHYHYYYYYYLFCNWKLLYSHPVNKHEFNWIITIPMTYYEINAVKYPDTARITW